MLKFSFIRVHSAVLLYEADVLRCPMINPYGTQIRVACAKELMYTSDNNRLSYLTQFVVEKMSS